MSRVGLVLWVFVLSSSTSFAQTTSSPTAGSVLQERLEQQRQRDLERTLQQKPPALDEDAPADEKIERSGRQIEVKTITVEGNTLLKEEEIRAITAPYENRTLTIEDIRELTAKITALYRSKGFVTSRAYLPPQAIDNGVLLIKIVEGKLGQVTVSGNKYFSSKLLRKKIPMKEGDYFDYPQFQKNLEVINEHPDRLVRANLVPGQEPGETDLVLEVYERRPFHAQIEFDNWIDENLGDYRFTLTLLHNNLLGFDDRLSLSALTSENGDLLLQQARYLFPVTNTLSLGGYAILTQTKPGRDFETLHAKGQGNIFGIFAINEFIRRPNLQMRANLGFDFKDAENKVLGATVSDDELRVLRLGNEWDFADRWGRNIFNFEEDIGFPNLFGAMADKDPGASRQGSGGSFQKFLMDYYRLQPLPWQMSLLWKNNAQLSNHSLTTIEQFQIGGPSSVRGYDLGQHAGDKGYYTSLEWSVPFYGLSKNINMPLVRDVKLYDAFRFVVFYDYGFTKSKYADIAGDKPNHNLSGIGWGVRLNPNNDIAMRMEIGYPLREKTAGVAHEPHLWFDMQFQF